MARRANKLDISAARAATVMERCNRNKLRRESRIQESHVEAMLETGNEAPSLYFDKGFLDGTNKETVEWLFGRWKFFFTRTPLEGERLRRDIQDCIIKPLPLELRGAFKTLLSSFLEDRFPSALKDIFPQETECVITGFGKGGLVDEDCHCRHSSLFTKDDGSHPLMYFLTNDFYFGPINIERIVEIIYSMLSGGCDMSEGICRNRADALREKYRWSLEKVYDLEAAYALSNQPLYEEKNGTVRPLNIKAAHTHSSILNVIRFFGYIVEDEEGAYKWVNNMTKRLGGKCFVGGGFSHSTPPCKRIEEKSEIW